MVAKGSELPRLDCVEKMYEDSLHELSIFEGGFINFGYWTQDLSTNRQLSKIERLESQKDLYRHVANKLEIKSLDCILEVGCGLGLGAKLVFEEFNPSGVFGIDSSKHQVGKAKATNEMFLLSNPNLNFGQCCSSCLTFDDSSFDKVISIEAAQHFDSFNEFINESYRVLKKEGMIGIATFFGKNDASYKKAAKLIPTIETGVDKLVPIKTALAYLKNAGFKDIKIESIGQHVWPYLDKWIEQGDFKDSWDKNWLKGYQECLYDYYVIIAKK